MRAFRFIGALAVVMFGCSGTTAPPSQGERDSGPPQGDTAANPGDGRPDSPGDGGSDGSPAETRDTGVDDAVPDSSPTQAGDFVGSIVWDVAQGDQFDLVVNFVVGVRRPGSSGAQPVCAGGNQVGSCCFRKASGAPASTGGDAGAQSSPTARVAGSAAAGAAAADVCPRFGDPPDNNAVAGVLSFTDNGKVTGQGIRDSATGYHYRPTDGAPLGWNGGDELGVVVPGGPCIPAASGKIRAVAPLISVGNLGAVPPETIKIDQGFTLKWTPDPNADTVRISFGGTPRGGGMALCECQVADASGQLVVPAAATQMFEPSPDVVSIVIVHRSSERQVGPNMFVRSDYNFAVPTHLQ